VKKLLVVMGVVLLVAVLAALLLLRKLDPESLGQEVIRRVNATEGTHLQAQRFSLNLLKGLELEQARATSELPAGPLEVSLERMRLEHRLAPLLKGQLVVDKLLLQRPQIELLTRAKPEAVPATPAPGPSEEPEPAAADAEGHGLTVAVSEIRIREGSLEVRTEGSDAPGLEVRGFDLDLRDASLDPSAPTPARRLEAHGSIRIDSIVTEAMAFKDVDADLRLEQGHARMDSFTLHSDNANLQVQGLDVDLNHDPIRYSLELGGGLDLNALMGATDQGGFGPLTLDLTAAGTGPDSGNLKGGGVLRLAAGDLPTTPLMAGLEQVLGREFLTGKDYQATEIRFNLADNRLTVEPFELVSGNLKLGAAGRIDLRGPLDLGLQVLTPRQSIKVREIPDEALDGLTDDQGWTAVPFKVAGTLQQPKVSLDTAALAEAAKRQAKQRLREEADEGVEKLRRGLMDRLSGH
jgi:uncharacterized protein involved in outer membrane biogenesis